MNMLALHKANVARDKEWNPDHKCDLDFWGVELAGEVGETCNIIKKIERERLGMRGSRATLQELADELADCVICVDLIACHIKMQLDPGNLPIAIRLGTLATMGNEMAAASGMINHLIAKEEPAMLVSMLCILVHRIEAIAQIQKIDLELAVKTKFNATSEKYKLKTRME